MKNCCFTGHRNVKVTARLINNISETICSLIETHGITEYYSGGAVGWDMLCENVVLSLKEKYPFIHLHLILPCPLKFKQNYGLKLIKIHTTIY